MLFFNMKFVNNKFSLLCELFTQPSTQNASKNEN